MEKTADSSRPRVLVVDDDPIAREIACGWLEELGYYPVAADTASAAMARLNESRFDVLFADVYLKEDVDGFQLSVAAVNRQQHIKPLFVSANAWGLNQADDPETTFLHKPYSRCELDRALGVVLRG